MVSKYSFSLLLLPLLLVPSLAIADPVYTYAGSALDEFSPSSNGPDVTRGWKFTVGSNSLSVQSFAFAVPTTANLTVTLWDATEQAPLASANFENTAAQSWVYYTLPSSVTLDAGATYALTIHWSGEKDYYLAWRSAPALPSPDFTYNAMVYCNPCSATTYPTSVLPASALYGLVDFGYTAAGAGSPVPEPSSMILLSSALGGLGLVAFRRRRACR